MKMKNSRDIGENEGETKNGRQANKMKIIIYDIIHSIRRKILISKINKLPKEQREFLEELNKMKNEQNLTRQYWKPRAKRFSKREVVEILKSKMGDKLMGDNSPQTKPDSVEADNSRGNLTEFSVRRDKTADTQDKT